MAFGSLEQDQQDVMGEINMTPMVDVMLVLLIIFMVTVPVMKHSAEVALPKAATQVEQVKPETIQLSVDAQGAFTLNQQAVPDAQLAPQLSALVAKNSQAVLHIYGDKKVPYERVAIAMTTANRAGFKKVAFVTDPS